VHPGGAAPGDHHDQADSQPDQRDARRES
jgi:hypothetical protein